VSGNARMCLQYNGAGASALAVAKATAAATAATAAHAAYAASASAANFAAVTAANAAKAKADAAVAAANAAEGTTLDKRMTVYFNGSVETTSGLTFGAQTGLRMNEGAAGLTTGARVYMKSGSLEVGAGNINGAIEWMPGVYSPNVGLTGLGWGGLIMNTDAKGYWVWDAYSDSGNGAEGIEVMYSAGSFSGHLSYSDTDLGSAGNNTAAHVAYTMGDWTVAVGMQDSSVNTLDKTLVTVGGTVGDFKVGVGYADNDGETKLALNGAATMGAVTVSAYVASEESATDNPMGLGVAYDLGGAKVVGGVARTAAGVTRADAGVSFSF
jgi:outer membrane protein OmpU